MICPAVMSGSDIDGRAKTTCGWGTDIRRTDGIEGGERQGPVIKQPVVGCSEDLGAGLDRNRPGLSEVEKAAEEGKMDVLLVKKLSRLGRYTTQMLEFLQGLKQLGIKLYSPLEGEIRLEQGLSILLC